MKSIVPSRSDSAQPWIQLAPDYERARSRDDSLDRLVEWPAQRECLGDITGRSVLDLGCGNGGKLAELVRAGAGASLGVDISGSFITNRPSGLELVEGDLSELDSVAALAGRRFDRIMFLQSFGYTSDPVRTLRAARTMLTEDGFILLSRTQPIVTPSIAPNGTGRRSARSTSVGACTPTAAAGTTRSRSPSSPTRCRTC